MKVYVLLGGEKYEGGDVLGVFSTREKAMERAARCVDPLGRTFQLEQEEGDYAYFAAAGCDFVSVNGHEVIK